ncbi:TetR/AcrR family transcriptional regulator [Tengunoibacter tsumagoiensis]|uniref:TetR family transcriptional regulator n=1 Tax=Tengunoibacter tsumagoiensis TaxID=2014871 RepID=A0A401ZW82_9CHLR|nr:TetR family transcriptional regulator [Tengunoibacter tsumagoiensis]GCE11148.1 TetR family transcriptional regulator [Tengunoibacter tsumagoiensis]
MEKGRRAIDDEQKEVRRQTILDTAWQLYQQHSYETLTIADVAQATGLAKGTIFLYFKTKEALFLVVVEQQLESWFFEVNGVLESLAGRATIPQIAALFNDSLGKRPALTRLLAILHTLLEQNIDESAARQFKRMLKEHFLQTGNWLEKSLPFLGLGQGAHCLLQCYALVIGFWHLTDAAPIVRRVLQEEEFQMFALDFAREFPLAMQSLLYGLEHEAHLKKEV